MKLHKAIVDDLVSPLSACRSSVSRAGVGRARRKIWLLFRTIGHSLKAWPETNAFCGSLPVCDYAGRLLTGDVATDGSCSFDSAMQYRPIVRCSFCFTAQFPNSAWSNISQQNDKRLTKNNCRRNSATRYNLSLSNPTATLQWCLALRVLCLSNKHSTVLLIQCLLQILLACRLLSIAELSLSCSDLARCIFDVCTCILFYYFYFFSIFLYFFNFFFFRISCVRTNDK